MYCVVMGAVGYRKVTGGTRRKYLLALRCPPPHTEALHFQHKLDETTKLLRNLQEAQKERLSAKQPPNMICLLAPTAKEMELGKSLALHGFLCSSTQAVDPTTPHLPL